MACPNFYPVARFEDKRWIQPPRLPLGDPHAGICRASQSQPDEATLRECCNIGYAAGRCPHAAPLSSDAIRFSIVSDSPGTLEIVYIFEKEHQPIEHGRLHYSIETRQITNPIPTELMQRQAEAFAASHLRRRPA